MASENETERSEALADIVREMRTRSREVKEAFGGSHDGVENMLDIWADRIKAIDSADAWRSLYTPGNAAAIREALETIHGKVNSLDEECGVDPVEIRDIARAALSEPAPTTEKSSAVGNAEAMREALVNLDKWLFIGVDGYVHGQPDKTGEIEHTIKAALSAPPRNYDSGKAPRELLEEYLHGRGFSSPSQIGAIYELALPVVEWLFAPSAERKGGAK